MSTRILFIILAVCSLQTGCDIINPEEQIPTYVHIDSFTFVNPNPTQTGTGLQEINTVWAYLDGENIGVFDLPATIPVLLTGKKQLQLAPGVNNQGLKDYKLQYPFFSFYTYELEANPGQTINLQPETKYEPDLKYWKDDFEANTKFIKLSGDTTMRRVTGADSVLEGGGAGCISLLSGSYETAESFAAFDIKPGTKCFLEISYKGTLAFTAGVIGVLPSTSGFQSSYLAGVKAKDQWGKVYIDLQPFTTQYPSIVSWSVMIKATLEEGQTEGYLLLDNIKVISY
jgi:hypothetical protein